MNGYVPCQHDGHQREGADTYQYENSAMSGAFGPGFDSHQTLSGTLENGDMGGTLDPTWASYQTNSGSFAEDAIPGMYDFPDAYALDSTYLSQEPHPFVPSGPRCDGAPLDIWGSPLAYDFPSANGTQSPYGEDTQGSFSEDTSISARHIAAFPAYTYTPLSGTDPAAFQPVTQTGPTAMPSDLLTSSSLAHSYTPASHAESATTEHHTLSRSSAVPHDIIAKFCERLSAETSTQYGGRLLRSLQEGRGVLIHKNIKMQKSSHRYWDAMKRFIHQAWSDDAPDISTEVWGLSGQGTAVDGFELRRYTWDKINTESEHWSASAGIHGRQPTVDAHTVAALCAVRKEGVVGNEAIAIARVRANSARAEAKRKAKLTSEQREGLLLRKRNAERQRRANETSVATMDRLSKQNERRRRRRELKNLDSHVGGDHSH